MTAFKASFDTTSKVVSSIAIALLSVIAIATHSFLATGIVALGLVAAYAWSPAGYLISNQSLVVRRLVGDARIGLTNIRDVRTATPDDFSHCIRLFGSGGLFGYYGIFSTSRLGRSTWYVTNRDNSVIVVTDTKTAVLSPDDVTGFIAALRPAGTITANPTMFASVEGGSVGNSPWIGIAIAGLVTALIAAVALYAPGPPTYTLTRESLAIHDRFYPVTVKATDVEVAGTRVIDFSRDEEWKPVAKTEGFSTARYHSGWFRLANGKTVRMYRSDGTRLLMISPKGKAPIVLLESKDPDKLLLDIRHSWAPGF